MKAQDSCNRLLVQGYGQVSVSFDNGDDDVHLRPLNDGNWQETWHPQNPTAQVALTIHAKTDQLELDTPPILGSLQMPTDKPEFTLSSMGSLFPPPQAPVQPLSIAPGSFISIYGQRLADNTAVAPGPGYPTMGLANALVHFGDLLLAPIQSVTELPNGQGFQLNTVVPYEVPAGTNYQVRIERGHTTSVPVAIATADAQPFFDQSLGYAIVQHADYTLVTSDAPAKAGDVLMFYCVGLGLTDNAQVADGVPSPYPANTTQATLTIGGQPAQVLFSGLAPGFIGLYQVNAVMPSGVPSGSATVTITVSGQTSPPVQLYVQ